MPQTHKQLSLYGLDSSKLLKDPQFAWVHPEVLKDLSGLHLAAKAAGFDLQVYSGYRDFHQQLAIWNNKWRGQRPILDANSQALDITQLSDQQKMQAILRWSALPGASRHHWGTDFDFYDPSLLPKGETLQLIPQEYAIGGCQNSLSEWLQANAADYHFFYPYRRFQGGVEFEPWHLSHWPSSEKLLAELDARQILQHLKEANAAGFSCIEQNIEQIMTQYVRNICLPEK
jgi:LAS superfamily LD-carboxypeptidase LdcB